MGRIQWIEDLNRANGQEGGNSFCLIAWAETIVFSDPWSQYETSALDLQTEGFWTRNYTTDSPSLQTWATHWIWTIGHRGLPACQLQVLGHLSLCNCVSYFLFEEGSFSLSLSHKHTLTHTHTYSPLRNFQKWEFHFHV